MRAAIACCKQSGASKLLMAATVDVLSGLTVLHVDQVQRKDKPLVAAQAKTLARLIQGNAANKDMLHRLGQCHQLVL